MLNKWCCLRVLLLSSHWVWCVQAPATARIKINQLVYVFSLCLGIVKIIDDSWCSWCCAALIFTLLDLLPVCVCVCMCVCVCVCVCVQRGEETTAKCHSAIPTFRLRNYRCSITSTRLIITKFQTALKSTMRAIHPSESYSHPDLTPAWPPTPTRSLHLTHLRTLSHRRNEMQVTELPF